MYPKDGTFKPHQDRFFGDAQNKANIRQADFDQEHLERHHDLLFRGSQVKEHRIAGLGEGTLTLTTAEDASLATLGHIGGNGANVASVHQPIMSIAEIGARMAPIRGFAPFFLIMSGAAGLPWK